MDIVLVPGLWLDGASWDAVAAELERAGHTPRAVTLPGMEAKDAVRADVTLEDCLSAVTAEIDAAAGPVVLVGHSAGAGIATAALDQRVDRVARVILIGGFPARDGVPIMSGFATEEGGIPFPDVSDFDEADLRDLDGDALERFRDGAIPSPAAIATEAAHLRDDRRYGVPVVAVATEYSVADLRAWISEGAASVQEFPRYHDVTYMDLPTGHWPHITKPIDLAELIIAHVPAT